MVRARRRLERCEYQIPLPSNCVYLITHKYAHPQSYPFGWDPDDDGFRGHIFATEDNSTVVVTIKGTSVPYVGDGGPTSEKDRFNDNLLFSCCCARIDWTWTPVCGCYRGGWKCDQDCLEDALAEDSVFYNLGTVSAPLYKANHDRSTL